MNLSDTQRLLWRLISAPEGVANALEETTGDALLLAATVRGEPESEAAAKPALSPTRRLDVYAEAYFSRIHDVLAKDFCDLAAQLGADSFHDLVTSYLSICPPERPSLRDVGQRLPEFLAHGTGGEPFRKRAAWAPDLARLEWTQVDLFDAPDAEIATRSDFETLPAAEWGDAALRLVPAAGLLTLDWPVHLLCASWPGATSSADAQTAIAATHTAVLVWRASETVSYRPLEEAEAEALAQVSAGTRFGEVCQLAAQRINEREAPGQAANWLARWLGDGVLCRAN